MGKMTVEFDTDNKKVVIDRDKSCLTTEEDLLESAILASRLLISISDILSKSKDKIITAKLSALKDNLYVILESIIKESEI